MTKLFKIVCLATTMTSLVAHANPSQFPTFEGKENNQHAICHLTILRDYKSSMRVMFRVSSAENLIHLEIYSLDFKSAPNPNSKVYELEASTSENGQRVIRHVRMKLDEFKTQSWAHIELIRETFNPVTGSNSQPIYRCQDMRLIKAAGSAPDSALEHAYPRQL